MFSFDNIQNGEEVYQRCVLITGRCENIEQAGSSEPCVSVTTSSPSGESTFPEQRWPICQGWFKALVLLNPGANTLGFVAGSCRASITLSYVPLLQTPPLHLAIMVARDSPLLIDCPPAKYGAVSDAHAGLDAAIAKLRVTACMWQALTAEEMRSNGLGRRSFRLEEEWAAATLSREHVVKRQRPAVLGHIGMQSMPKVHIVRADKTTEELRDPNLAQQNARGKNRDELHGIFTRALKAYGAPFNADTRPVVAGLILDSTYHVEKDLILGHAALGAHHPNGLSLGIFGSHLTYAWPRFFEEISACLLDTRVPGDAVGNDNGECATMWEACTVGQGAFLHEVGHAFSAPHTTGIMARGYSRDWAQCFLSQTAYSGYKNREGIRPVTTGSVHNCHWDLSDLLRFRMLPHFKLPTDLAAPSEGNQRVLVSVEDVDEITSIVATCPVGFVKASLNEEPVEGGLSVASPSYALRWPLDELEARFGRSEPLQLKLLCLNGKESTHSLWAMVSERRIVKVKGTSIYLQRQVVHGHGDERPAHQDIAEHFWSWTVMLKRRDKSGHIVTADQIDLRVGCALDGAVVRYRDGTQIPCGPRTQGGIRMGGHQAKKLALPAGADVTKVAVSRQTDGGEGCVLSGLRMWLSNGKARGALNRSEGQTEIKFLGKNPPPPPFFFINFGCIVFLSFKFVEKNENKKNRRRRSAK